jgi:hypothetical protein
MVYDTHNIMNSHYIVKKKAENIKINISRAKTDIWLTRQQQHNNNNLMG